MPYIYIYIYNIGVDMSLFCADVTDSSCSYFRVRQLAANPKSAVCVIQLYQSILKLRPLRSMLCHHAVALLIRHEAIFQEFLNLVVLMGRESLI